MKKILLFLLLITSNLVFGQTYNFSKPTLTKNGEYTKVEQKMCNNYGLSGDPFLPYYLVKTNLKSNQILNSIDIISVEYYPTEKDIKIEYKDNEFTDFSNYIPATHSSKYSLIKYPENIINIINNNYFTICPVVYYPKTNNAKFIKSITIKKNISTKYQLKSLSSTTITNPFDLLIITKNDFVTATNPYVIYKQKQGYYTKLITTETIYSTYTGIDKQEKIRNCIKDYYNNNGIKYVLLIGTSLPTMPDKDGIPHRGMWGQYPFPDGTPEYDIPADVYYSNLDGTWRDSNGHYGTVGTEDLTQEVAIGRIPAVYASDVTNWINKVIKYQDNPVINDILKMGMVGELVNSQYQLYGSKDMENLITTGSIPNRYTFYKLYDSVGINNTTNTNVLNLYNTGKHIINHLGHSGGCWNMNLSCGYYMPRDERQWIFNDGINTTYSIVYSQGCYAGALDMRDGTPKYTAEDPLHLRCVSGEAVTSQNACVAYITNTRYGFYDFNSNGSSQRYQREFLKALYTKNITKIGDAMNESKNMIAPFIPNPMSGTNIRWTYYTLSLWGDPTMDIWTDVPTDIIASYPTSVSYGITSINITTNTPKSRVSLVGSNGVLIGRAMSDDNGNATVTFTQPINTISYLDLTITGSNKNKFTGRININYSQVQGYVTYNNTSNTPLKNVTVRLYYGEQYYETSTDNTGIYKFYNIPPGSYNMKVITNKSVGSINSVDSQLIMNHFVGTSKLTGLALKSADVNLDGAINSIDALLVSRYFVGETLPSNIVIGKWVFDEKNINVNRLNVIISIKGLAYGDVNASYIPN